MTEININLEPSPESNEPEIVKVSVNLPVQLARDAKALASLRGLSLSDYYTTAINNHNSEILRIIQAEQTRDSVRYLSVVAEKWTSALPNTKK
jgi:hypothetical protein